MISALRHDLRLTSRGILYNALYSFGIASHRKVLFLAFISNTT